MGHKICKYAFAGVALSVLTACGDDPKPQTVTVTPTPTPTPASEFTITGDVTTNPSNEILNADGQAVKDAFTSTSQCGKGPEEHKQNFTIHGQLKDQDGQISTRILKVGIDGGVLYNKDDEAIIDSFRTKLLEEHNIKFSAESEGDIAARFKGLENFRYEVDGACPKFMNKAADSMTLTASKITKMSAPEVGEDPYCSPQQYYEHALDYTVSGFLQYPQIGKEQAHEINGRVTLRDLHGVSAEDAITTVLSKHNIDLSNGRDGSAGVLYSGLLNLKALADTNCPNFDKTPAAAAQTPAP